MLNICLFIKAPTIMATIHTLFYYTYISDEQRGLTMSISFFSYNFPFVNILIKPQLYYN